MHTEDFTAQRPLESVFPFQTLAGGNWAEFSELSSVIATNSFFPNNHDLDHIYILEKVIQVQHIIYIIVQYS